MLIFIASIVSILLKQKNIHESHKKVCESKDFCNILMSSEETSILEFYRYQKFDKALFIIYADLECLLKKINGCRNNPEKLIYGKSR